MAECSEFVEKSNTRTAAIAARYSIIADAIESSFIVNGGCNAPCERRRGGKGGAQTLGQPADQYPFANFVKISFVWAPEFFRHFHFRNAANPSP